MAVVAAYVRLVVFHTSRAALRLMREYVIGDLLVVVVIAAILVWLDPVKLMENVTGYVVYPMLAFLALAALAFLVGLVGAPYAIYRDQTVEMAVLRTELTNVRGELDARARVQAKADELALLRAEAVQLLNRRPMPSNDAGLSAWMELQEAWHARVVTALQDLPPATQLKFQNLGSLSAVSFSQAIGEQHNHQLLMLNRRIEILEEIIDRLSA